MAAAVWLAGSAAAADITLKDGEVSLALAVAVDGSVSPAALAVPTREVLTFSPATERGLWKFDLFDARSQSTVTLTPADAQRKLNIADSNETVTVWSRFTKAGTAYQIEVVQRWILRNRRDLQLKLEVRNPTALALTLVQFPVLSFRVPAGAEADLKLVLPTGTAGL